MGTPGSNSVWRLLAVVPFCAMLGGCGSGPPSASQGKWTLVAEKGKPYVFDASFRLRGGQEGWFTPNLVLLDQEGCPTSEFLQSVFPASMHKPEDFLGRFHEEIATKGPIARATLTLVYRPDGATPGDDSSEQTVFRDERVLDPSVQPAELVTCAERRRKTETGVERKRRLREKAKTDPEGADAEAIDHMGRNELVATAINTAGFLCARVTSMYPAGNGIIIANCVEYRNGSGRVKYRVDAAAGTVEQM